MLRKAARNNAAVIHRRLQFVPFRHASPAYHRLYCVPPPTPPPTAAKLPAGDQPPLPLPPHKKPKLDLRPAPVKPKPPSPPASAPPPPTTASTTPQTSAPHHVPATPSLSEASKEAKHDIEDAEAHGILAPPPLNANWVQRTLHQVIQIAKFYYRGTKLIFTRRKAIALIHARVQAGGAPLTRAEFRLITTQKDDMAKLVPFLIIALLLEEVIPLIAIYVPAMLPSTCILPSQRARIEEKRTEKALAYETVYAGLYAALKEQTAAAKGFLPLAALRVEDAPMAVCGQLGLSTIGFDALRLRRIRKHLSFIARDDEKLLEDSTPLSRRALVEAIEERGIRTSPNLTHKQLQSRLQWWLDSVKATTELADAAATDAALGRRLALVILSAGQS
ncbi:hypothetical protein BDN70DRAFT_872480 [Pholiota conissans]|uniref:Letm1 RBD domain-containing protein n=1 Tax=Pholiota conissans TaxID=109636 RepID=A0A9P5ZBP3_9AGAR|nr:hypothetical protein BDN70DRAFT_872480 [Pholiota conissans]